MLKNIILKAFQSLGIYVVYLNLYNTLASGVFVFDIDTSLLPFFLILAAVNASLSKEEALYSHGLNTR